MLFGRMRKKSDDIARNITISYVIDKATGDKYIALAGEYLDRRKYRVFLDLQFAKTVSSNLADIIDDADVE